MTWPRATGPAAVDRALGDLESALLSGRIDELARMEAALQAAIAGLTGGSEAQLEHLRDRSGQVGRLLQGARAGLRDARAALAAPQGFSAYDAQGRADPVGRPRTRFERRR